jgi:hypothetical protein
MANAATLKANARERVERLKRGEDVAGGLERPKTYKEWLKWLGWNATDVRHARLLGEMDELGLWDEFMQESHKRREAGERARDRAAARAVLRRRSNGDGH